MDKFLKNDCICSRQSLLIYSVSVQVVVRNLLGVATMRKKEEGYREITLLSGG